MGNILCVYLLCKFLFDWWSHINGNISRGDRTCITVHLIFEFTIRTVCDIRVSTCFLIKVFHVHVVWNSGSSFLIMIWWHVWFVATTNILHKMIDFGDPTLFLVTKGSSLRTDHTEIKISRSSTELFPSLILFSNKVIHCKMCGRSQIKSRFIDTTQWIYCVLDPFTLLLSKIGATYNTFFRHRCK